MQRRVEKFRNFKVLNADELIDKAFRRSVRITSRDYKEMAINRVSTFAGVVTAHFEKVIAGFNFDISESKRFAAFYNELVNLLIDRKKSEENLRKIKWLKSKIEALRREHVSKIKRSRTRAEVYKHRKAFYGRACSLIRDFDAVLKFLEEARRKLEDLPVLKERFTIVIAGMPNVGKSTLLKALTGSEPEIRSYPFTTKKILIGYMHDEKGREYQIIDTPGLLDRAIKERNEIEKQAIIALKHIADLIIFIFDPSFSCGYSLNEQVDVYREVKEMLKKNMLVAYNKIDIADNTSYAEFFDSEIIFCSAEKNIGIAEIKEAIKKLAEK